MRDLRKISSSRSVVNKEPRDIGKKNPGKTYLPRFLDKTNVENLKASVERELADISMYMEQERQVTSKIVPGSQFKGQWDACTNQYPDANDENSTWDVIVSCGHSHDFDGKTWLPGQQLLYLSRSKKYIQRTNPGADGIKQEVETLKIRVDNAEAGIETNKTVIAETNFALSELDTKLTAKVNENTGLIQQTNTAIATLTDVVAENKLLLEAKIGENTAKIAQTNSAVSSLTDVVATNKTELQAKIDKNTADLVITNQTVASLEGSISTNVTQLRSEFQAADKAVADKAAADLSVTNQTVANLNQSLAQNITALRSEYQAADQTVANKAAADLSVTNQTVANNAQAAASATSALKAEMDGNVASINSQMSTVVNKVGTLESKWTVQADVNGKISGIEMVNNGRQSNFTIQTDRFVVTDGSSTVQPFTIESGKTTMNNAVVRGHIEAGSGTFKGRIEADSGYFNGSLNVQAQGGNVGMKITNNQILIYDQNGVLRVKIGQL